MQPDAAQRAFVESSCRGICRRVRPAPPGRHGQRSEVALSAGSPAAPAWRQNRAGDDPGSAFRRESLGARAVRMQDGPVRWRHSTITRGDFEVKTLILFVGWCILFVLAWPVALLALVLFPVVWLLVLPFRLVGIAVDAVFALLKALLFLPARVLGHRG